MQGEIGLPFHWRFHWLPNHLSSKSTYTLCKVVTKTPHKMVSTLINLKIKQTLATLIGSKVFKNHKDFQQKNRYHKVHVGSIRSDTLLKSQWTFKWHSLAPVTPNPKKHLHIYFLNVKLCRPHRQLIHCLIYNFSFVVLLCSCT